MVPLFGKVAFQIRHKLTQAGGVPVLLAQGNLAPNNWHAHNGHDGEEIANDFLVILLGGRVPLFGLRRAIVAK